MSSPINSLKKSSIRNGGSDSPIRIGINGFGRIGKCVFLQLLWDPTIEIAAINALNLRTSNFEEYIKHDSVHRYPQNFQVEVIDSQKIKINHHTIILLSDREAKNLHWKSYNIDYVIDATGSYLTQDACRQHDVNYVIISAPATDETKTFVYGVNHEDYLGESIISAASCTTNAICPALKIIDDHFHLKNASFTTIHSTTASQSTVDILRGRSIFNNIIPHSTGANAAIAKILPNLSCTVPGTSMRIPISNVSLIDLTFEVDQPFSYDSLIKIIKESNYYDILYQINQLNLVSCDFLTTTTPTICDFHSSVKISDHKMKLMIWYDNEWAYSAQLIRLLKYLSTLHSLKKVEEKQE